MAKAGDAGNYKDLEADVNRLRELAIMYGDANGKFQTRRPDVVLLITQEPATKEELNRITTKYRAARRPAERPGSRGRGRL
jgi:hypothetical protein